MNRILKQVESQLQVEEKLARKSALRLLQPNDEAIKAKARQNLTQMVNKLRDSAEELGVVSEKKLSALMTEDYLGQRAKRGQRDKFLAVLDAAADVEPIEEDKI